MKKYGGHKVLIHYGGGSVVRLGSSGPCEKSLDEEGIEYVELGGVKASPLSDLIYEGIDLARREKVDFVLALGGGSVDGFRKRHRVGSVYDGDFWDSTAARRGR